MVIPSRISTGSPLLIHNLSESGLIIFKLIEGTLARTDIRVEVLMDDMVFPSFSSAKVRSKHMTFGESKLNQYD